MTRRAFLARMGAGTAVALGMAGAPWTVAAQVTPAKRPNLLFVMSDQHRWDFMGCAGHPLAQTPTLDRLAAEGVRFDAAYCHYPVCVPSRMSIITGRYPHSHGALSNAYALPQDQLTIGAYLKSFGYQTAAVGKMHFVDEDQHHGFDYRAEKAEYAEEANEGAGGAKRAGGGRRGGISGETEEQTYEHFLADKTIEWLEKNKDKAFCAWCSFVAPHPPFIAPESLFKLYEGKVQLPPQPPVPNPLLKNSREGWEKLTKEEALTIMAAYLGRIALVDMNAGRVLEALERLGLADNTIVSYTSDHGDMQWQQGRFGKMTMYDGATRIPLILRYAPRVPKGTVRHEVVEQVDLFPTFCDLLGVPTPSTVQGRTLMPLLEGKAADWPNTAFIEMSNSVIVRASRHKCRFETDKALELYDLEKDPQEWENLIGKPGSDTIVAEMTRLLNDWRKRTQPDVRSQVKPYQGGKARAKKAQAKKGPSAGNAGKTGQAKGPRRRSKESKTQ